MADRYSDLFRMLSFGIRILTESLSLSVPCAVNREPVNLHERT